MAHAATGAGNKTSLPTRSSLQFNTPVNSSTTTVFRIVLPADAPAGPYRMFTQHVPHEFSASFLTCAAGACAASGLAPYVYPSDTSLYLGKSTYTKEWTVTTKVSRGWAQNTVAGDDDGGANAATTAPAVAVGAIVAAVGAAALSLVTL